MSSRPGPGVTQFVVIIFILEARFPFFYSKAISHSKPISYGTQQNIYYKKTVFNPSFSSQFTAWVILFIYENDGAIPFLYPICTRYENGLLCYFMNSPYIFCMGNGNGCKSHVTLSFKNSYIYIIKVGSTRITHS